MQKGFILWYLLLIGGVILGVVLWITSQPKQAPTNSPSSIKANEVYQDLELKFQFEYPKDFEVVNESEEQYSERTKTQYRKNFKYYVAYEPTKFVKGLVVKPKDMKLTSNQFEEIPLTLWVFENSNKLDSQAWYNQFWYYPFVWGIFDEPRKSTIAPKEGSASVSYQPGKPKFILLPKDDKMFLFRIIDEDSSNGRKVFESFKFLL